MLIHEYSSRLIMTCHVFWNDSVSLLSRARRISYFTILKYDALPSYSDGSHHYQRNYHSLFGIASRNNERMNSEQECRLISTRFTNWNYYFFGVFASVLSREKKKNEADIERHTLLSRIAIENCCTVCARRTFRVCMHVWVLYERVAVPRGFLLAFACLSMYERALVHNPTLWMLNSYPMKSQTCAVCTQHTYAHEPERKMKKEI